MEQQSGSKLALLWDTDWVNSKGQQLVPALALWLVEQKAGELETVLDTVKVKSKVPLSVSVHWRVLQSAGELETFDTFWLEQQ